MVEIECLKYAEEIASIAAKEVAECDCSLLSGGIDTTFLILNHPKRSTLKAVTADLGGLDVTYATLVAKKLNIGTHVILKPSTKEIIQAVDWVLTNLKTIDPVEVSADAVHYITITWAIKEGCKCLLSGDGGDEMFLGYTFLAEKNPSELTEWLKTMAESAWLPTVEIGKLLGLEVKAPLYSREVREKALSIPLHCMIRKGSQGKLLLRAYIESKGLKEIAWRPKEPITTGSGAMRALKSLTKSWNPSTEELKLVEELLNFKPHSKLQTFLAYRMLKINIKPPEPVKEPPSCPVCSRRLTRGYCRFCGAYVTKDGTVQYYTDDQL